jgi:hypothetical protein
MAAFGPPPDHPAAPSKRRPNFVQPLGSTSKLFDYVNLVSNPFRAFAPGDHGLSSEDVRRRFVFTGAFSLPGRIEIAALGQFESTLYAALRA